MAEDDRTEQLADRLSAGIAALRAGRPEEAVPALTDVCDDPELAAAADLRDIRARALSLCGQALLLSGRTAEALGRLDAALALARALGETEGIQEIEVLREQALKASAAAASAPPAASADDIEARVKDPIARAELLIRKATAEIDAGRIAEGTEIATRALIAAPRAPRVGVLARLALARARLAEGSTARAEELLAAAAELARDADEHTLLAAVAREAERAGLVLEAQHGPDLVGRRSG